MNIVVPYTRIAPETLKALRKTGLPFQMVRVGDDDRYWNLLSRLWGEGEDFAIVEHDIVVGPRTLKSFDGCPEEWCVAPYPFLHRLCSGLGCTRFRGELLRRYPDVLDEVAEVDHPLFPGTKNWRTLDACIRDRLWERGVVRCRHRPVGHVGLHGCDCPPHLHEPEGRIDHSWRPIERSTP